MGARNAAVLILVLGLAAVTAYEALVALRVIELGDVPGEGAPGAGLVGVLAGVGLLAAAFVSFVLARSGRAPAAAALLAPAAGAFLLAFFYTFDPYYLPTLIRYSERDFVPPPLVFALAALALAAGLGTLLRRRAGLVLSVPAILACALAAFWAGVGH